MVQQLSLAASALPGNLEKLLLTLKALTGQYAQPMHQHTIILRPRYPFTPEPAPGKVTQIESYRIRMTRIWDSDSKLTVSETLFGESIKKQDTSINDSIWTLQLSDIPAGGKTQVSIQNIYETTIYETDDIIGYLDELGYMHETEYWVNGVRFYYGDVIIELSRLYIQDDNKNANNASSNEAQIDLTEETSVIDGAKSKLKLLNPNGSYFMKAFVNVGEVTDLESVAIATRQLDNLKKELEEVVTLRIPDRTSMDSRVNSKIASVNSSLNLNKGV